jgi:hypothetical protein
MNTFDHIVGEVHPKVTIVVQTATNSVVVAVESHLRSRHGHVSSSECA